MAYLWEVTEALSLLCEADENDETVVSICTKALDEINSRLKPDADLTDPRITAAAAGQAFYNLTVKRLGTQSTENLSGFKAGDLSISYDTVNHTQALETAKEIRDTAFRELTPLLSDNGFFFGSVRV